MSFYINFNSMSSFFEMSEFVELTEDVKEAAGDSIEEASQSAPTEAQTNILPKVDDSLENPVFAIEFNEPAIVAVPQISPVIEFNNETLETTAEKQNPKIEAENEYENDSYEKFHSLLKKFEISLQYRYDFTDIFKTNLETKNSQDLDKLIEKNLNKQRIARQEDVEKRFREKQAENFKEQLKQKRFASQLQNKSK